jgi:hypothetical protein
MMSNVRDFLRRCAVIYNIVILIAPVHIFRVGTFLEGELYDLYGYILRRYY